MAIELIGLEITNRCNYACVHCLRADIAPRKDLPPDVQNAIGPANTRHDIPLDLIEKLIDEARPFNIPEVSFTGGEPTLHRQFDEIVKMFCEAGYKFNMVTNGTRFERTYQAIKPFQDQLSLICFSMDGATEETMDFIREKGSFRRSLQAISVCKVKNLPFSIQMVVTETNRHEIEAMAHLASQLGAKRVSFAPLQPTLLTTYKNMNLSPKACYEIKREIADLQNVYNASVESFIAFPDDTSPWVQCNALSMRALYVDYRGNVTFCCQLSEYADSQVRTDIIGNLSEVSLFDALSQYFDMISRYQKEKMRRFKNGELNKLEAAFACWYCFKYFKKVEWMKKFPNDPWHEDAMRSIDSEREDELIPSDGRISSQIIPVESLIGS